MVVIGGTGMLRGVAVEFARRGWNVSVIGRRAAALEDLVRQAGRLARRIAPLRADYTSTAFAERLRKRLDELGPARTAVAWVHVTAPGAPLLAARELASAAAGEGPVDFVHVLARVRTRDRRDRSMTVPYMYEAEMRALPGLDYRQAILGWAVEADRSRWLTDQEISAAIVGAIDSGAPINPIGRIDPNPAGSHPTHG